MHAQVKSNTAKTYRNTKLSAGEVEFSMPELNASNDG